jgi:hypothetical protein
MRSKKEIIEQNLEYVNKCLSERKPISELARFFNMNYNTVRKHLKTLGIDYPTNPSRKGLPHLEARKSAYYYLNNSTTIAASKLRKLLIQEKIKEPKCEICGLSEWRGKPIPLELHHKDGNHWNNNLENLQILCSNCHMQEHNYSNVK